MFSLKKKSSILFPFSVVCAHVWSPTADTLSSSTPRGISDTRWTSLFSFCFSEIQQDQTQRRRNNTHQGIGSESVGQHHPLSEGVIFIIIFLQLRWTFNAQPSVFPWDVPSENCKHKNENKKLFRLLETKQKLWLWF